MSFESDLKELHRLIDAMPDEEHELLRLSLERRHADLLRSLKPKEYRAALERLGRILEAFPEAKVERVLDYAEGLASKEGAVSIAGSDSLKSREGNGENRGKNSLFSRSESPHSSPPK